MDITFGRNVDEILEMEGYSNAGKEKHLDI